MCRVDCRARRAPRAGATPRARDAGAEGKRDFRVVLVRAPGGGERCG